MFRKWASELKTAWTQLEKCAVPLDASPWEEAHIYISALESRVAELEKSLRPQAPEGHASAPRTAAMIAQDRLAS
jgi:hypothetical protein